MSLSKRFGACVELKVCTLYLCVCKNPKRP